MVEPFYADRWLTVYGGDCRDVLRELPAESVHCVVTSPPYWGLRDYGTSGQLGLEQTPEEYVRAMVDVFREVRRVLRSDGTVWLNLGDSYASHDPAGWRQGEFLNPGGREPAKGQARNRSGNYRPGGLKPKDLVGIPWRVAFALQADGWYLRSDIIWSKPNPMPESVTDRPTKSHEYLFLLAKSSRYLFDADAVREPMTEASASRYGYAFGGAKAERLTAEEADGPGTRTHPIGVRTAGAGRNIRSVWTIATAPYPGAHFATFPPKLVEPCVKAGTSERGVCPDCGAPWERVVLRSTATPGQRPGYLAGTGVRNDGERAGHFIDARSETTGWRPTCRHEADPVPAVVLDPFAGTGTVGMVAQSLSRRAVLIDLNPDYLRQCLERAAREWGIGGPRLEDTGAEHPADSIWALG